MTKDRHFLSALFKKDILTCRGAAAIANPLQVFYFRFLPKFYPISEGW